MNEQTQHRLAGYLRVTLVLVGIVGISMGYGLWWSARMLIGNGCNVSWLTNPSPCQSTLLALQSQYLAALVAGVLALALAGVMTWLHRRALEGNDD